MQRCVSLARLGAANVAPNPMVGSLLVYKNRIIGEGYHKNFGEAHAEVNCINNVAECDQKFISESILYVSLEPCSHTGKTPPCVDLIIKNNIKHVVIGCTDLFKKVNGTGIDKLIAAGIKVEVDVLKNECIALNKSFFCFQKKKRPYIILKWAQSNDCFIAGESSGQIKISNSFSNVMVHKWRSEEAAILVGTNTAIKDNPSLTTRHWMGKNPVRIIIDATLKLNHQLNIFNNETPTIIINRENSVIKNNTIFYKIVDNDSIVTSIVKCLYEQELNSVIIEGGAKTIQSFIDVNLWDEAIIITNTGLEIGNGVQAPILNNYKKNSVINIFTDKIEFLENTTNEPL